MNNLLGNHSLGGHSLLMVQVHERLGEALNADISMTDLFQYPTVSALATFVSRGSADPFAPVEERAGKQRSLMNPRLALYRPVPVTSAPGDARGVQQKLDQSSSRDRTRHR